MDLTVALDARYVVAPNGSAWSQFGMARQFWERYLEVFDRVRVVARAVPVDCAPKSWLPVNGPHILFHPLPNYCGPWEYLKNYRAFQTALRAAAPVSGAVVLRGASHVANALEPLLLRRRYPYALEVLGDPYEVFAPGVVEHPMRMFFRWYFTRRLQKQCLAAAGVAYVTRESLQRRYPTRAMAEGVSDVDLPEDALLGHNASTHYSSIELDPGGIADHERKPREHGPYRVVSVGSLAQLYKGMDTLIDAVERCARAGVDLTAVIVGDGRFRPELMRHAERLGVDSRIVFTGQVTAGEPVRRLLDSADLFVLASRTEGLPRAMIEAMARGLPCIGSAVGGIPELLSADDLFRPGDAAALAAKIREVLSNPERMAAMSRRNLATALDYRDTVLADRRRRFYRYVRDYTENWERTHAIGGVRA